MVVGTGPSRIRDWEEEVDIALDQYLALDGPNQEEGSKASLENMVSFLSQYITGGGGGGTLNISNVGNGAGVFAGMSGITAQLRSLRSTTSALAVTQGASEIVFSITLSSSSAHGLMSSSDKAKLDSLPGSIPHASSAVSGLMSNTDKVKLDELPGSIPLATQITPGLMSSTDKTRLDNMGSGGGGGIGGLVNTGAGAGVYSSMSAGNAQLRSLRSTTSALAIAQINGEINFAIASVSGGAAGLMSSSDKAKLDGLPTTLNLATPSVSGLMSSTDKTKLDGLPGSIPLATASIPGLMGTTDKTKLDGLPSTVENVQLASLGTGSAVYAGKNGGIHQFKSLRSNSPPLSLSSSANEISFSIATVTTGAAGLMTAADKTKLDGIPVGGGGGGGGTEPVPELVDFTLNNNTVTQINLSSYTPLGTWLVLTDASDPDTSVFVVVDFANSKVGLYANPGGGIDIVGSYGKFRAATGVLTGTTGPVGTVNISATSDYQVHLENRTGSNMVLRYFQTGGGSGGGAVSLGQLVDVDLTGLANGNVLTYNQSIGKWVPGTGGGGGGSGTYPRDAAFDSITIGDEIIGNRVSHSYDTDEGIYQIVVANNLGSSVLELTSNGDISFNGESLKPSLELAETLALCEQYRDEAIVARDLAEGYADLSRRWASDPVGAPIPGGGGAQSSYAYSQIALQTALASRILPSKIINESDIVSGKYTLKSGDLFLILAFRNTSNIQLVCPPNLWRDSRGEAWVMVRREGIGTITAVGLAGSVTSPIKLASRSIVRRYPTGVAAQTDITEVLNIPPMTNGKISVMCHSVHTTVGFKTLTLMSPTATIPSPTSVWSDPNYSGANEQMEQTMWEFNIASWPGGDVSFRLTIPAACQAVTAVITAINNAGGREDTLNVGMKSAGVQSTAQTSSQSTNGASRFALAQFAQRSHTAIPAILSGGMFQDLVANTVGQGAATGDDSDRFGNIGSVSGYEIVPDANSSRIYGCQFAGADGPTSLLYCAYAPFSTTTVTSIVRAATGVPSIDAQDGVAMLHLSPDGLTYFFNAG